MCCSSLSCPSASLKLSIVVAKYEAAIVLMFEMIFVGFSLIFSVSYACETALMIYAREAVSTSYTSRKFGGILETT